MARPQFEVHLDVFDGPFDLLLGLIAKHKLDVTEVALAKVTDDFLAYINAYGSEWDLEQTTHFLVVAATLLDLKAARLLPQADIDDEDDLALLEARDLLFARLMQYKAYKQVAAEFAGRMAEANRIYPRSVTLEPRYADVLPEVVLAVGAEDLARMAAVALVPKEPERVGVEHIHHPAVSVREQAVLLVERLRKCRQSNFRTLTADCANSIEVIARFLALLELFRESVVSFEQVTPLGELNVRWTGSDDQDVQVSDEYDRLGPTAPAGGTAPDAEAGGPDPSDQPSGGGQQ
ncbi:MAG: segregation/condensation protein A [Streptosporangiales bacterium]|nr:segregation/condensation protein A [Streptosporangiales bacterium]